MNSYPDQSLSFAAESSAAYLLTRDHLTPDQVDDHLIGDLAPSAATHLAACPLCADRVAAAASPIANFQQVSTAWSERRSATLPLPVPTQQRPIWQRHMGWATASLSLAFGIALVNAGHQFSALTTPEPVPSVSAGLTAPRQPIVAPQAPAFTETASLSPSTRASQISADNRMLRAIDASLNPSADSPAALGLTRATISNGPPASIQD